MHWFNPFAWAAFILMGADMEMSCDESVIKEMGDSAKKDYSMSLLTLASNRKVVSGSPLAFSEGGLKNRIKNVLSFKKSSKIVFAVAAVLAMVLGIGLSVNGISEYQNSELDYENTNLTENDIEATADLHMQYAISQGGNDVSSYESEAADYELMEEVVMRISAINDIISNVALAAENINGTLLNPGDIFFFNQVVGPRTIESGFVAPEVSGDDTVSPTVGNGVCRTASLLSYAVTHAGLEIVERRSHGEAVDFTPGGYDAAVSSCGLLDFRFRNDTEFPILIRMYVNDNELSVSLFSAVTRLL
jgi:hypothetical protein